MKVLYWFHFNKKKYNNYLILKWIKRAKKRYINEHKDGMCTSLAYTIPTQIKLNIIQIYSLKNGNFSVIKEIIPEYYPEFFGTKKIEDCFSFNEGYWWKIEDRDSRINAFNKLIEIYERKLM